MLWILKRGEQTSFLKRIYRTNLFANIYNLRIHFEMFGVLKKAAKKHHRMVRFLMNQKLIAVSKYKDRKKKLNKKDRNKQQQPNRLQIKTVIVRFHSTQWMIWSGRFCFVFCNRCSTRIVFAFINILLYRHSHSVRIACLSNWFLFVRWKHNIQYDVCMYILNILSREQNSVVVLNSWSCLSEHIIRPDR